MVINVVCFRFRPAGYDEKELNAINERLNHLLNDSGTMYLSHTTLNGKYVLRMVTGQTNVTIDHVEKAWARVLQTARNITG